MNVAASDGERRVMPDRANAKEKPTAPAKSMNWRNVSARLLWVRVVSFHLLDAPAPVDAIALSLCAGLSTHRTRGEQSARRVKHN